MRFIFLLLTFLGLFSQVFGQIKPKNLRSLPLPFIYYTPETNLAGGAMLMNLFKISPQDSIARTSNVRLGFTYTLNRQILTDIQYNLFFKEEKYNMNGDIIYQKFPQTFYGIGNETILSNAEQINFQQFHWTLRALRKIKNRSFVGLQLLYNNLFAIKSKNGGFFDQNSRIHGKNGGLSLGVGAIIFNDHRDNILNASKGSYLEASILSYNKILGSDFSYLAINLEYRKYFYIKEGQTIALRAMLNARIGEVPFHRLGMLGGEYLMRGYYNGRFRDNYLISLQAEYRRHIYKRLGMILFSDFGQVANQIENLEFSKTRFTVGLGIRFSIDKKERINIRLDFGLGKDMQGIYSGLSEIF